MTIEEIFESRTVQYTGVASVISAITLNLAMSSWIRGGALKQFITDMDINNAFVIATSGLGILFLLIKIATSWFNFIEKIEDRIKEGKRVSKFILFITGNRSSKKKK